MMQLNKLFLWCQTATHSLYLYYVQGKIYTEVRIQCDVGEGFIGIIIYYIKYSGRLSRNFIKSITVENKFVIWIFIYYRIMILS